MQSEMAAIDQLPAGYKSMFLLHDVQGYEHNEIANMLGCSIGNSKSQLHKARKRLRSVRNDVRLLASALGDHREGDAGNVALRRVLLKKARAALTPRRATTGTPAASAWSR